MTDNGPDIIDPDRGKNPTEGHIQIGLLCGALDTESSMKAKIMFYS